VETAAVETAAVETATGQDDPAQDGSGTPAGQDATTPAPRKRNRSRSRGSRPAVPSWDDIMFGTKKD